MSGLLAMDTPFYAVLGFVLCGIWYARYHTKKRLQPPYPPGPPPRFLLGNILDFPFKKPWAVYSEWKNRYGDIIYLNLMGQPIIVVNSLEVCIDLLDKRSAIYSDRPRFVMLNEIMGWDWGIPFMHYSDRWRANRRMLHRYMNEHAVQDYHPTQERHAHKFLHNLLETPDQFIHHIRLAFVASIMDVVYGIDVEDFDNVYVRTAEAASHGLSVAGTPGSFLVDVLPWLKFVPAWFPGAGFQERGAKWKAETMEMNRLPYEHVKKSMAAGIAGSSVMASMLSHCDGDSGPTVIKEGINVDDSLEDIARNAAAISYAGGSDTTPSSVQSFFLAMAKWPEVQMAAQAEIDAVVGNSRLPTFKDRENMPYMQALIKEILRWLPVAPLGFAHASIRDDEYKGYFIPKGTIVLPNAWTILHDPSIYPDPHTFNPERFLTKTPQGWKLNPNVLDPGFAFGFGRRICPGRYFADSSLFITASNVLAVFKISPPLDSSGKPMHLDADTTDDMILYPAPYKVAITPRSQRAALLVQESELL